MELFSRKIEGEINAEEQTRLGIGNWRISEETIREIEVIENNSREAMVRAKEIILD